MNLQNRLTDVLGELDCAQSASDCAQSGFFGTGKYPLSWKDVTPLIDLTLLDNKATPKDVHDLAMKAYQNKVAAICVLPEHLDYVSPEINITRATVINFPTGNEPQKQLLKIVEQTATLKRVDEIDYVFSYQAYLAGNQHQALSCCHEVYQLCKQHGLTFKVILETGALPSIESVYDLSAAIIDKGCDFLKTSTGKIATGASIPAVFAILAAIVENKATCGIKVSGGIKTMEQAFNYMQLAHHMLNRKIDNTWFRLGASSLLDVLTSMGA